MTYVDAYLSLLIAVMQQLSVTQSEMEREDIKRFIGSFFLIDSIKLNNIKMFYVSCLHPLFLVQGERQERCYGCLDRYNELGKQGGRITSALWKSLLSVIWVRNIPKKLFGESVIYSLDRRGIYPKEGFFAVRQMRTLATLTSIDS